MAVLFPFRAERRPGRRGVNRKRRSVRRPMAFSAEFVRPDVVAGAVGRRRFGAAAASLVRAMKMGRRSKGAVQNIPPVGIPEYATWRLVISR